MVRLVAASGARVTLLFGRIRRVDPSARVAPTPRHLPYDPTYGARRPLVGRVAPTCRAAATRRSEESRPGVADSRQTHESRSRSDKVRLIRPRRPVRLRDGPRRGAAGGKQEPRAQARARAPQKSNAAQTNESLAIQHRSTFRVYISCVRGGGATAYTVLALAYNHISYDTTTLFMPSYSTVIRGY